MGSTTCSARTSLIFAVSDDGELVSSTNEGEPGEEEHVNGHSFGVMEPADEDIPVEDEPTEEAIEEFIADENFIESDDAEVVEEIKEEIEEETEVHGTGGDDMENGEDDVEEENDEEDDEEEKNRE